MKNNGFSLFLLAVACIFFASCSSSKLVCPTFTNGSNTSFALKNEKAGRKEATTVWKRSGKHNPPLPAATPKPEAQLPAETATAGPLNNHGNPSVPPQNSFAATNNPNADLLAATTPPPVYEPAAHTAAVGASGYKVNRPFAAVRQLRQVKKAVSQFGQTGFSMPLDSVKNTATPQQQNTDKADKMALAGGILAIAGWFVPYIGIIAVPIGVALCIVALKRGTKRKKFVKRVLIFTGVMLLFTIYVLAVFIDW